MRHLCYLLALPALGVLLTIAPAQPPTKDGPPKQPSGKAAPVTAAPGAPIAPPVCPPPCPHPLDGRTIVFVANGAGGGDTLTENLREASSCTKAHLAILNVSWCRQGTVKADNADQKGQLRAAARLAERFNDLQCECPHSRFIFVGYSAGTRVVLAAAELLPPGSLDRIVLLGAGVSSYYDLQIALQASCGGIDSFYSHDDSVLEQMSSMYGTTDGRKGPVAGLSGFRLPPDVAECAYGNLRQYRWTSRYGGMGDHRYWVSDVFLGRTLLPLLQTPGCNVGPGTPVPPPTLVVPPAPVAPKTPTAVPSHSEPPLSR